MLFKSAVRLTPTGQDYYVPAVIFGADGETVLFSTANPGNVQLVGSTVALPVDLQYVNVPTSNPLPVSAQGTAAPHSYTLTNTVTVPYTNFVGTSASGTAVGQEYKITMPITRYALRRLFLVNNGINVGISGDVWPVDTNTNGLSLITGEANYVGNFSVSYGNQVPYSSTPTTNYWADTDQLSWDASPGSNVATGGTLYINIYEMF